jgi:hypothetical protein
MFSPRNVDIPSAFPAIERALAHTSQEGSFGGGVAHIRPFRHRLGQPQQPPHALWKSIIPEFDIARAAQRRAVADKGHEA